MIFCNKNLDTLFLYTSQFHNLSSLRKEIDKRLSVFLKPDASFIEYYNSIK